MTKSFFGGVVVSQEVDAIARELIEEFQIPKLHNLAFMLNVNKCFNDLQALRLRLQRQLDDGQANYANLAMKARLYLTNLAYT